MKKVIIGFVILVIVVSAVLAITQPWDKEGGWTRKPTDWSVYSESRDVLGYVLFEISLLPGNYEIVNPSNCWIHLRNQDPERGKIGLPMGDRISAPTGTRFTGPILLSAECTVNQTLPKEGGLHFKPVE